MSVAYGDEYWDKFAEEGLSEYRNVYDAKLKRNIRKWFPDAKKAVLPRLVRPRWVVTQPPTTTGTPTTEATVTTPPIIPPGTVIKQTTLDKLLDFGKYQIQQKVELEKARQAAGIAPGTIPTQAQQAAMMQNFAESNSVGSQAGKATDTALAWLGDNILVVGAGVLIVTLLFMNPPGRK